MWLVVIFLTSFKVHIDIIYTVSGPNKHSQDALDLNSCYFKVIYIYNCKATHRHCPKIMKIKESALKQHWRLWDNQITDD